MMEKIDNNNVFVYENIDVRLDPKIEKNNKLCRVMIDQIKSRRAAYKLSQDYKWMIANLRLLTNEKPNEWNNIPLCV